MHDRVTYIHVVLPGLHTSLGQTHHKSALTPGSFDVVCLCVGTVCSPEPLSAVMPKKEAFRQEQITHCLQCVMVVMLMKRSGWTAGKSLQKCPWFLCPVDSEMHLHLAGGAVMFELGAVLGAPVCAVGTLAGHTFTSCFQKLIPAVQHLGDKGTIPGKQTYCCNIFSLFLPEQGVDF